MASSSPRAPQENPCRGGCPTALQSLVRSSRSDARGAFPGGSRDLSGEPQLRRGCVFPQLRKSALAPRAGAELRAALRSGAATDPGPACSGFCSHISSQGALPWDPAERRASLALLSLPPCQGRDAAGTHVALWQAGPDLAAFPCAGWAAARAGASCFPPPDFSWSSSSHGHSAPPAAARLGS